MKQKSIDKIAMQKQWGLSGEMVQYNSINLRGNVKLAWDSCEWRVGLGEACRHFSTRVREHLAMDKNSHIYKHLNSSKTCKKPVSNESCFTILDTAKWSYELKIKEALHINWLNPTLNSQLSHANLTLDL